MAFAVDNVILASDFIAIKARVKAECQRRCYEGSIVSYASSEYDYTNTPTSGEQVRAEHFNKIVEPLNAINNTGYSSVSVGDDIKDMTNLVSKLSEYENYPTFGAHSGCNAQCTGLCTTTCGNTCMGCTGTCEETCIGGCEDSCSSSCTGSCTGSCTSCTGCTGSCSGGCQGGCYGCSGCGGSCSPGCGGCSTSCASYCQYTCSRVTE